ncbi:MAG: hypothetical protein H6659_07860 [Ardenticatenaceae bacterium]|nr:hypothetical protein [Ardenticatenaceae bacterium]MCB8987422.1 hypothetical protein [Ardenticatenaceae bacterium]
MQNFIVPTPSRGYLFHPGHSHFGYEQVDVTLTTEPTQEHFDPEKVHLYVGSGRSVQSLDIHHPWHLAADYPIIAGRIILTDRRQKHVEVFTLGGQMTITGQPEQTKCVFTSPAPFMDLITGHSVSTLLVNEIEILLAERRAARNFRISGEFDNLLLAVDPLTLYTCCLHHIREKFKHYPIYYDHVLQHFRYLLQLEIEQLQSDDLWPDHMPELAELI